MSIIGTSPIRTDGFEKVRGEALYAIDLREAGMLHGRLVRSPVPAGRLVSIDTERAARMPGVRAVITAADVPDTRAGWIVRDTPLFARGVVRFVGEPVAAVAADTEAQARAAAEAVLVQIEEMPAVTEIEQALTPGAPLVHPDWESYESLPGMELRRRDNIASAFSAEIGSVDEAFRRAHRIVEDEYRSNRQYQAYLEPKSAIAIYRNRRFLVHTGHQYTFNVRDRIAQFLAVSPSDVQVKGNTIGGAFGGKLDYGLEPYAAALSRAARGRPVRIANTFAEDLLTAGSRDDAIVKIRSALDASGAILGREFIVHLGNGAYTGELAAMPPVALHIAGAVYRVGSARVAADLVYTNTPPTGAFRGVSGVSMYTALERHMDHIARTLGVDRREYRLRQLFGRGDRLLNGQVLEDAHILKTAFDEVEKIAPWGKLRARRKPHRGVGIAAAVWMTNSTPSSVTVKLSEDGTVSVLSGSSDIGSGAFTAGVVQIVAEELGLQAKDVILARTDTDADAYDVGSQGSRTVRMVGGAAQRAAQKLRARILEGAAPLLQAKPEELELAGGAVCRRDTPAVQVPLALVALMDVFQKGPIVATARYAEAPPAFDPERTRGALFSAFPGVTYHVHLAEVEVSPVTGNVRVLRYVVAQEVGRAINPANIRGQIQGGVAQGLGLALCESLRLKDGRFMERTMEAYRLPLALDVPDVEIVLLEHPDTQGPHGVRGAAEPPIALVPAVIGNAVADAIGRPLHRTPITPEDVLKALAERA